MTASQAKVVRFHETGDASVLKIELEPLQTPGDDEVRINVEAIGLNRAEVMFRRGAYLEQPVLPSKIGYEVAGVIAAVGKNVTEFKPGDRVSTIPGFSMSKYGTYGESPVVPATAVARYPENFSAQQGTSIWMQYVRKVPAYPLNSRLWRMSASEARVIPISDSPVSVAWRSVPIGACTCPSVRIATCGSMMRRGIWRGW